MGQKWAKNGPKKPILPFLAIGKKILLVKNNLQSGFKSDNCAIHARFYMGVLEANKGPIMGQKWAKKIFLLFLAIGKKIFIVKKNLDNVFKSVQCATHTIFFWGGFREQ